MAADAKMAGDLANFATAGLKSVDSTANLLKAFALFFIKILEVQESRQQLINFYQDGLHEDVKLSTGEKLSIVSYSIHPNYAKQLYDICKRDHIGHLNTQTNTFDLVMDGKGDNIKGINDSVWIYSTQKGEFHRAVAEAKARSGYEQEIPREMANTFLYKLMKDKNPMLEIKDIPLAKYIALRRDIQKLEPDMRFTLFPKYNEKDGVKMVDVGFLSKTERLYDKKGNPYVDPQQYDIPELMKGILVKQQLLERDEESSVYFELISEKEKTKQDIIDELLKTRPSTVNSIRKEIEAAKIDDITKLKLVTLLKKYYQDPGSKFELINAVKKIEMLDNLNKNRLLKSIEELGKEMYVIPVKIVKDAGELEYEASIKDSIYLGRDLTIRSAGKADLVIEDETSLRSNLDRKLTEYTEAGKEVGKEYSFVVLNENEFRGLEEGNPEFVSSNNRLKKKHINFLVEHDDPSKFEDNLNITEVEKSAEGIIETINKNKDKFMLESDCSFVNMERFDEYHESTIGTILVEEDHKEGVGDTEIETQTTNLKEAISEVNQTEIAPAGKQDGFNQYIDTQVGRTTGIPEIGRESNELIR